MNERATKRMFQILKECESEAMQAGMLRPEQPLLKPTLSSTPAWAKALVGINTISVALMGWLWVELPRRALIHEQPTATLGNVEDPSQVETRTLNLTLSPLDPVATDLSGRVRYYPDYFAQPSTPRDSGLYRPYEAHQINTLGF